MRPKISIQARHNNFDREAYTVTNMATYIELLDKVINVFTTFIAAVSAISLVVGRHRRDEYHVCFR